jgi:ferrous iron transport protein B
MSNCGPTCDTCKDHTLERLGLRVDHWDYTVALAGNPNTGKSTIFNALTGLRQHTGNWPGKTIARAEGGFSYAGKNFKIVDLPGTYSLLSATPDEEVARDFILFGRPDVTVVVVDGMRLERNLNLVLQVLQITDRAVVCVNLVDEAKAHGIEVDCRGLARDLGVPVVPAAARQGEGIPELLKEMYAVASGEVTGKPYRLKYEVPQLSQAVAKTAEMLRQAFPNLPHVEWIALRLLEGDRRVISALESHELGQLAGDHSATAVNA